MVLHLIGSLLSFSFGTENCLRKELLEAPRFLPFRFAGEKPLMLACVRVCVRVCWPIFCPAHHIYGTPLLGDEDP